MNAPSRQQYVILCEGYDDRSFWAGWLLYLGCEDPSNQGKKRVKDIYGKTVGSGSFLFRTPRDVVIIVKPYHGRSKLGFAVKDYIDEQGTCPIDRLILNLDSDAEDDSGSNARDAVRGILIRHGATLDPTSVLEADIAGIRVSAVVWECNDEGGIPGIPRKQTLERLVAASIRAAYPDRGPTVEKWLGAEPKGEGPMTPKNYSYSYLAKWYAEHGADDFFRALWRDEAVARQLRQRLEERGAWAVARALTAAE